MRRLRVLGGDRRGFLLVTAVAIVFVLATLTVALFRDSSFSTAFVGGLSSHAQGDAALHWGRTEVCQALDAGKTDTTLPTVSALPPGNIVSAEAHFNSSDPTYSSIDQPNALTGTSVSGWLSPGSGVAAIGYQVAGTAVSLTLPAWHAAAGFMVRNRNYVAFYDSGLPYAAYAPRGAITISGTAVGFTNPLVLGGSNASSSGTAVVLRAGSGIQAGSVPVGRAICTVPQIHISGGALPVVTGLSADVDDQVAQPLEQQLDTARSRLLEAVDDDKTGFVAGAPLQASDMAAAFIKAVGGGKMDLGGLGLNLNTAMHFPMPYLLTFRTEAIVTYLYFHIPAPPDLPGAAVQDVNSIVQAVQAIVAAMQIFGLEPNQDATGTDNAISDMSSKNMQNAVLSFVDLAVNALGSILSNATSGSSHGSNPLKNLVNGVKGIAKTFTSSELSDLKNLIGQVKDLPKTIKGLIEVFSHLSAALATPQTEKQDAAFDNYGYSYLETFGGFVNLIVDFSKRLKDGLPGVLTSLLDANTEQVRLVHFVAHDLDGTENARQMDLDTAGGTVTVAATWNVPAGQTLQLGACLRIRCHLEKPRLLGFTRRR